MEDIDIISFKSRTQTSVILIFALVEINSEKKWRVTCLEGEISI